jgi:hypothetical protein
LINRVAEPEQLDAEVEKTRCQHCRQTTRCCCNGERAFLSPG